MSDLTISIVNFNAASHLEKCLSSLIFHTKEISYEIMVVDNASSDGSLEILKRFPQVKVIRNSENFFFTKAQNQILRGTSGRYAVILNPDVYFTENALKRCVEFLDSHSDVGAVGPKILNKDGTFQGSGDRLPSVAYGFFELLLLNALWKNNPVRSFRIQKGWNRDSTKEVESLGGSCIVLRTSLLKEVGLLDERFLMYWEETDWCKRAGAAGLKIYFLADTSVIHVGSQSANLLGKWEKDKIFYQSMLTYYEKHFGWSVALILRMVWLFFTRPILWMKG